MPMGHQQITATPSDFDMLAAAQNNVRSYMVGSEHGALLTQDTMAVGPTVALEFS